MSSQTQMPLFKLPLVITPDYRNNGKFQFVTGYTGGFAAEMCVHLTWEEIEERLKEKHGPGVLTDDGTDLIWTFDDGIEGIE
jgi:hypothetical protein